MEWLNLYGLLFMAVIMVPNVAFALSGKGGFANLWRNRAVEALEQIGRFGCFALMIFNIPGTWWGFASDETFAIYLIANGILVLAYCLVWIVCFRRNGVFRALALSILPSAVFLISGILSRSVLLTVAAAIFAPCHIAISYQNARIARKGN